MRIIAAVDAKIMTTIMNITIMSIITMITVVVDVVMTTTMTMMTNQLQQRQTVREKGRQQYLLLRNLAVPIVQVKWKNRFHICQE